MLAPMSALRVSAAALLTAAVLGSSCSGQAIPDCGVPSPIETGTNGAPDPCHCAPPPSLDLQACPCLSGTPGEVDLYNVCLTLYRDEMMDAGAD